MKAKNIIPIIAISIASTLFTIFIYNYFTANNKNEVLIPNENDTSNYPLTNYQSSAYTEPISFTNAADKSVNAVVHVKTSYMQQSVPTLFDFFFGGNYEIKQQPVVASGSGVIISNDGYIVTNNHVINGSDYIEVVLNDQRSYEAKLIGSDSKTDIALLKIEEKSLPFIPYGDSDNLMVGEWVLAVGNPFNLTSTVTAGIISAKARNINILSNYSIEAFIQFDAAVNPGNSGGALVNTKGELIGINTAIASKNGSFVGYSFAIPVNIVKKITSDLIEFGEVQRAYLGLTIVELNAERAAKLGIEEKKGVYVTILSENGAAQDAGMKEGDIVLSLGDFNINSVPQLHEQLSKYRPGDKVEIKVKRNNKTKNLHVTLKNRNGTTEIVKTETIEIFGAIIKDIPTSDKQNLRLKYGAKIDNLNDGKLKSAGVKKGFIITSINRSPVYTAEDVKTRLESIDGSILLEGYYSNGISAYYTFGI